MVDTEGNLLNVNVHAANTHDTVAGGRVFEDTTDKWPAIQGVCADAGYRGTFVGFVVDILGKTVEIVERASTKWEALPKRWIVERTLAWFNPFRRLSKDYEIKTNSEENVVYIAHSMVLLKRLNKP